MDLAQLDKIKINFIVGSGRSGTTLLVYIFNQNPNCIASPEMKHFMHFYSKYKDVRKVSEKLIDDYKKYLKFYSENKRLFISSMSETLLDKLEIGQDINYSRLTKLFFFCLTEEKQDINEINIIIDKNPYYTFYLKTITSCFPDAKIVFMLRDYRGFVLSNRQNQKNGVSILSVCYYALVWNLFLKKALYAQKKQGANILFIKYENLAINKEDTIKTIADYFDIKYSPVMLDFYQTVQEKFKEKKLTVLQYESATKKIASLSRPVNNDRVNAWEKELTKTEIQKIEFLSASYGKLVGYDPIMSAPKTIQKIHIQLISIPAKLRILVFNILNSPKLKFYFDYKKSNK